MRARAQIEVPNPDRFWAMVDRRRPDECWPWRGTLNGSGYGHFNAAKRTFVASRVAWFLANGRQPEGVCHRCDNPPCCNPAHLRVGTHRDNMLDIRRRKAADTHCPNGHEWTPENTRIAPRGTRLCKACNLAAAHRYKTRRKEMA